MELLCRFLSHIKMIKVTVMLVQSPNISIILIIFSSVFFLFFMIPKMLHTHHGLNDGLNIGKIY